MQICYKCEKKVGPHDSFHGLHQECFRLWFGHSSLVDFTDVSLKRADDLSSADLPPLHTSFFHGKFKKYSAQLDNKSYILKVQQSEYAELPQIEYLSNIIAQKLGLYVPPFYFIRFLNEMDTFVVHNFMENYQPGNLIHLYHFLKEDDEFSVRNILAIISDKVGRLEASAWCLQARRMDRWTNAQTIQVHYCPDRRKIRDEWAGRTKKWIRVNVQDWIGFDIRHVAKYVGAVRGPAATSEHRFAVPLAE